MNMVFIGQMFEAFGCIVSLLAFGTLPFISMGLVIYEDKKILPAILLIIWFVLASYMLVMMKYY